VTLVEAISMADVTALIEAGTGSTIMEKVVKPFTRLCYG
jgi:hypothetical protein